MLHTKKHLLLAISRTDDNVDIALPETIAWSDFAPTSNRNDGFSIPYRGALFDECESNENHELIPRKVIDFSHQKDIASRLWALFDNHNVYSTDLASDVLMLEKLDLLCGCHLRASRMKLLPLSDLKISGNADQLHLKLKAVTEDYGLHYGADKKSVVKCAWELTRLINRSIHSSASTGHGEMFEQLSKGQNKPGSLCLIDNITSLAGGLLAGDLVGSVYEGLPGSNHRRPLLTEDSHFTDDSYNALVAYRCMNPVKTSHLLAPNEFVKSFREVLLPYQAHGFSFDMQNWICGDIEGGHMEGNGAGVRAAALQLMDPTNPCMDMAVDLLCGATHSQETVGYAKILTEVIRQDLRVPTTLSGTKVMLENRLPMYTLFDADIFQEACFDASLWWTLPAALHIGLNANSWEHLFEMVLYIGGDTDSIGAMAGAVGHARWGLKGMPKDVLNKVEEEVAAFAKSYG